MPPAIRADCLSKSYGPKRVLHDVSFEVSPGEVFALLGRNGAGKTTTIEILEGYRTSDSGTAWVLGKDTSRLDRRTKAQMGVMLEELGLYPGLTVAQTLHLFSSYYPDPLPADGLMERLELQGVADSKTRTLSTGERQRLSLALALIGRPSAVFLDEPTAGADPVTRRTCLEVVAELAHNGAAVLLTTHHLDEAEQAADTAAILSKGMLVESGPMKDLVRGGITIETDRPLDLSTVGARFILTAPNRYTSDDDVTPEEIASITALAAKQGVTVRSIDRERSLESLFFRVTSER